MSIKSIIFSILVLIILVLTGIIVYQKWRLFKELRVGDSCYRLVNKNTGVELKLEDILKVDVDFNGYTIKIYTESGSYTFLDFFRNEINVKYEL